MDHPDPDLLPRGARLIARLARFCADLYRTVPIEGQGVIGQAGELVHAAELEADAAMIEAGVPADGHDTTAITPSDLRAACQLLIDVRRAPARVAPAELRLVRQHFPEVEADDLAPLETVIAFYTGLLSDAPDDEGA